MTGEFEIVNALIKHGAKTDIENGEGKTAQQIAVETKQTMEENIATYGNITRVLEAKDKQTESEH